jgi:hypothetical protein
LRCDRLCCRGNRFGCIGGGCFRRGGRGLTLGSPLEALDSFQSEMDMPAAKRCRRSNRASAPGPRQGRRAAVLRPSRGSSSAARWLPCGTARTRRRGSCAGRPVAARPACKLDLDGLGCGVVRTLLDKKWSPQQVATTLERLFPDEPERHVFCETLCTASTRRTSS